MISAKWKNNRKLQITFAFIVLVALISLVFLPHLKSQTSKQVSQKSSSESASQSATANKTNTTVPTKSGNKSQNTSSSVNNQAPLDKPILNKSSGNSGPVPAGAIINFVCIYSASGSCDVVLQSQEETSVKIDLGFKNVVEDHGQTAVSWYWTAIKGKWLVTAVGQLGSSQVNSDSQTLEVQ